jgi:phospholipid-binding lipoprotein MlaA
MYITSFKEVWKNMMMAKKSFAGVFALAILAVLPLSACSTMGDPSEISDPLEGVNRGVFKFNDAVDTAVLEPVARGYRAGVPQPARTGIRNFLQNLKSPLTIGNNLLQGDLNGAGDATTRMFANSLFGFAGVVDVAGKEGVRYQEEDFGQTLGKWGLGHGAYLVLPLFGPSSVRDTTGMLVDGYADPIRIWLTNTDNEGWYYARAGIAAVDKREELLDVLADLKKNSIDYYAAVRSTYAQRREALLNDNNPEAANIPDIP